jgi:phosphatidylglycerophosphatase A
VLSMQNAFESLKDINPNPVGLKNRPSGGFMLRHPAHLIALGLGSGLSPIMPGTVGTIYGWLTFHLLTHWLLPISWLWYLPLSFLLGVWACTLTAKHMGVPDHGAMVWDEIVAFWLVLLMIGPTTFGGELGAFLLFRFFDMVKPPPIRNIDLRFKRLDWWGGFGVMLDDILAAFYTLLCIAVWRVI